MLDACAASTFHTSTLHTSPLIKPRLLTSRLFTSLSCNLAIFTPRLFTTDHSYGPPRDAYDPKALWPLRGGFALLTATFASLARGMAASARQPNARPDNEAMQELELWGCRLT
jgi:hypothetical protein